MKKRFFAFALALVAAACACVALGGCDLFNHTHSASEKWSCDSAYHWHNCTGFLCAEKLDKEEHAFEYIQGVEATCTQGGNAECWHCTVCDRYFSAETSGTELKELYVSALGHSPVTVPDGQTHYSTCERCGEILSEAAPHRADGYIKDKTGHYKVCLDCGAKFDEGAHTEGDTCSVCGYTANYEDLCASDYGYKYLGTLENGASYQEFYEKLDGIAVVFHDDENETADSVAVTGSTVYVAGKANYSSLKLTKDQAISVWATYRNDHPLYYWLDGQVVYSSDYLSLCVDADFKDGAARKAHNREIYAAIDEYLNAVSGETSAYMAAFAIHDRIIEQIDYARDSEGYPVTEAWAHGVSGVFTRGAAVCEGYAKAFSLLLNACGINNVFVTGVSKGEGHAWNMVELDGAWYWYDLTWDDQPSVGNGIIYDYFCKSGAEFAEHTVGETGNTADSANFLYALPAAATEDYDTSATEYGEQFTVGNFTYSVCGYGKVALVAANVSGSVSLSGEVTYNERVYVLSEIGKDAFTDNRRIISVTIPDTVCVINNFAFKGCTLLSRAVFADASGWTRTVNGTTTEIASASLESATQAAKLLKETYSSGAYVYQYVWKKTAPNK